MAFYQNRDDVLITRFLNFAWVRDHDDMYHDFVRAVQLHYAVASRV